MKSCTNVTISLNKNDYDFLIQSPNGISETIRRAIAHYIGEGYNKDWKALHDARVQELQALHEAHDKLKVEVEALKKTPSPQPAQELLNETA